MSGCVNTLVFFITARIDRADGQGIELEHH